MHKKRLEKGKLLKYICFKMHIAAIFYMARFLIFSEKVICNLRDNTFTTWTHYSWLIKLGVSIWIVSPPASGGFYIFVLYLLHKAPLCCALLIGFNASLLKETFSQDGYFFLRSNILINTLGVCADGCQDLSTDFNYPVQILTFTCFFEITY
jgi:hypothetical protein